MTGIIKIESSRITRRIVGATEKLRQSRVKRKNTGFVMVENKAGRKYRCDPTTSRFANASLTGKHRTTRSRWLSKYRKGGLKGLLTQGKKTGRIRKIPTEVEERLQRELLEVEGFSSSKEVQAWLKAIEGIEMSYTRVYQIVRYRLKGKLKVPRPVHVKQESGVVEEFKKN